MGRNNEQDDEIQRLLSLSKQSTPHLLAASPPYTSITKLDLPDCGLSELPQGFEAAFPNLSILFLSKNKFAEVPAVIGKCPNLQMVAFKENELKTIHPDALKPHLRWLILTNNQLTSLPEEIGQCPKLQKFMLSGNQLESLPDTIQNCQNLELIRLASNQLKTMPTALIQKCPKLAWIALSDNPCLSSSPTKDDHSLTQIDLELSDTDQVLGRGAGGVTRKVMLQGKYVAVKEYGGAMTSDGLPETERRLACAAASLQSPALVHVLGETTQHGALVMEYLDGFVPLADPPSMESCSRDVYDNTSQTVVMTEEQAELLVTRLLEALAALHSAGICHGDFYGHNILLDSCDSANVRLTDLGAAFFYDKSSPSAPFIQQTEVRAFATMVGEVYQHFVVDKQQESKLLADLLDFLQQSLQSDSPPLSFESVLVWMRQQQLEAMAKKFEPDDE